VHRADRLAKSARAPYETARMRIVRRTARAWCVPALATGVSPPARTTRRAARAVVSSARRADSAKPAAWRGCVSRRTEVYGAV